MDPTFRFLHASDLHLERVAGGLAEVPDHLRGALADAAYRAAERIFDAAIKHRVDFLVLAGDVLDLRAAGPRAIVFLNEQFAKLAEAGIRVYWAGSRLDAFDHWNELWQLPDNVHRFACGQVESLVHYRAGEPLLRIAGASHGAQRDVEWDEFQDDEELFTVAVTCGEVESQTLARSEIAYWALGGAHTRRTLLGGTVAAHYCGTPQGRTPAESGPHGCTLVHVDDTDRVRTTFIPTDAVRYCEERLVLDAPQPYEALLAQLSERVGELLIDPFGPDLLIRWTISGDTALAGLLRSGKGAELLTALRTTHGTKQPSAWSVSIDCDTAHVPAERFEEETLLGEYLRSTRHYLEHVEEPMHLDAYLAQQHREGDLAALAALEGAPLRRRVLAEAAALGYELLSPPEDRS